MKTYKRYLISLCLFITFIFHIACYNQTAMLLSGLNKLGQLDNSKYGEFVFVQLNNGKNVFGYLKNVNNVNLTLECHDYEKLFNILTKNNKNLREREKCFVELENIGNTMVIDYNDIKAVIMPRAKNCIFTSINWFYRGQKILVTLKNGSQKRGTIISNKIKGIELRSENNQKLFLKWPDISQIKIIKKSLIKNILKKSLYLLLGMIGFGLIYIIFLTPTTIELPLR